FVPALLSALLVTGPPARGAAGDAPQPRKGRVSASTDVTLVEIPVHVVGKDGHPVRGLTRADFDLFDDGRRVTTFDLEVIDLEEFGRQTVTPDVPLPPAAQRHFLLLFDLTFAQPINIAKARHAAVDFVRGGMKNGDMGAVATVDVEKGIRLVLTFTSDRDQLAAAVSTLALPSLTSPTADPLALTVFNPASLGFAPGSGTQAAQAQSTTDAEFADTLAALGQQQQRIFDSYTMGRVVSLSRELTQLARMLNSVQGRKNLVYFSEGFDAKLLSGVTGPEAGRETGDAIVHGLYSRVDSDERYGRSEIRTALDQMFAVFRKSDCVIHTVDVSGLTAEGKGAEAASPADTTATDRLGSRGRGRDSLYTLSAETGGELFKNSNDVSGHLRKLQEQTSLVYLLSYTPAELTEPGRYHALSVKVKAPGAHASTRSGYYEPRGWSRMTPMERRLLAAQQIAWGLPRSDIAARAIATPFLAAEGQRARVPVILEIPGAPLVKNAAGEALNLEVFAYATDKALKVKDLLTQTIALDLARVGPRLAAAGIKFYGELSLPPGTYWLKILVRIAETGRSGLLIVPVTVPPEETRGLVALGPVFHEAPAPWIMVKAVPRAPSGAPPPYPFVSDGSSFVPSAGAPLDPSADAPFSVFLYNPPAGGDLALPGKGGVRIGTAAISRLSASRLGPDAPVNLLCSFRPEKLATGTYSLRISVTERRSGATGETLAFFEVR
ncbi:MAG TPA: VWA domain-containing protein, partial [Thermoanaerobaculia bacterium]|nr:VWA domain-containing protein [Thermoanaerobaculia bacterium]